MYHLKIKRPGPPWRDELCLHFERDEFNAILELMKELEKHSNEVLEFTISFE